MPLVTTESPPPAMLAGFRPLSARSHSHLCPQLKMERPFHTPINEQRALRPQCARLLAPTCPPSCSISGSRELPQPLPHTQPNELSVTTPSHSMFNTQTCGLARHQIVDWRPRDADDQL